MQRQPDNAEEQFKCARCGHMFGTEGRAQAACPQCGYVCNEQLCVMMGASNEEY